MIMLNRISSYYLKPQSHFYKIMEYLNHYLIFSVIFTTLIILSYPIYFLLEQYHLTYYYQQNIEQLTINIGQQKRLLHSLEEKQNKINSKDESITQANQKIKDILRKYDVQIENIQWQFDKGKRVYIIINQRAKVILSVIEQLNQLEHFNFEEINLVKLHREKLIQMNAVLVLSKK